MVTGYKQQTDIQDAKTIRIGSVKMEAGPYGGGYTNIGALVDASFVESWSDITVKSDNAGIIEEGITDHIVTVTGTWMEINVESLAIAFAGLGTADVVTTALVGVTDEAVVLTTFGLTELAYKNGAGTEVASISVDDAAAAAVTYVRDCDYVVVTKDNGYTTIARAYPTVIEGTDVTKIAVDSGGKTYTLSNDTWDKTPAIGDHITFAGFAETGNNGVKTVTASTSTVITVSETCTTEAEGATITSTMGGIADGATVYANYTYTPLVSRTYTTGGYTSKTARILRLTNTDADDLEWTMLVYKAYIGDGFNMSFPADDDRNPVPCPITFIGKIDSTRTIGDQLFSIDDAQDTD